MELTKELIDKAKTAESAEALLALAGENDIEMSAEEAEVCFAELHPQSGELSDEELENVSGGGCYEKRYKEVGPLQSCELWVCRTHKVPAKLRMDGRYCCPDCDNLHRLCRDCANCLIESGKKGMVYRCTKK